MKEIELRRLFLQIMKVAIPVPVALIGAACSSSQSDDGKQSTQASGGTSSTADPCAAPTNSGPAARPSCPAPVCVPFSGSIPDGGADGGILCDSLCNGSGYLSCQLVSSQGQKMVKCYHDCTGRRPCGLLPASFGDCDEIGEYFARMAHLEAASVAAFRRLERELAFHGAPRSLSRAARRATREEIRHARMTRALAERNSGTYVPPRIAATEPRSLEAMAIENVVEGCVRETFGALMATWQAANAVDPTVKRAMQTIARDETRHAALAWRVAAWLEPRLEEGSRRRLSAAQREAVRELGAELDTSPSPRLAAVAGIPSAMAARAMLAAMSDGLWSEVRRPLTAPSSPERERRHLRRRDTASG